jgi:AI-2 transport protein TqsA
VATSVSEISGDSSGSDSRATVNLPRGLTVILGAAGIVLIFIGVRAMAWLIGPVFLALIIVIAVAPVQDWLRSKRWPAWAANLVVLLAVYAIVLSLALAIIVSIARLATELPKYAGQSGDLLNSALAHLAKWGVGPDQIKQMTSSLDIGKLAGLIGGLLGSVAGLATNFVFLIALLLFLGVESSGWAARYAEIGVGRPMVVQALANFAHGTRQYLVVTTVFGFIVAVLDTAALAVMGIPLALTWGILAFVTNFIPNVGFILGVIPPALLGLLTGGPGLMVAVIAVYSVLNLVIQSLIQPRFIGDAVGLSTTMTFLSLVFWAWVLGGLGAILAVPLTLLIKAVLVDMDPKASWTNALTRSTGKRAGPEKTPDRSPQLLRASSLLDGVAAGNAEHGDSAGGLPGRGENDTTTRRQGTTDHE